MAAGQQRQRRVFKQRLDPFTEYNGVGLITRYRYDGQGIEHIGTLIDDFVSPATSRNCSIPTNLQVMIALRYFATGKMQLCNGDDFGIHQSTVSRIVQRVSTALTRPHIIRRYIKFPTDAQIIHRHQTDFHAIANFPGVLGAIDGTHFRILRPTVNEEEFVNRKNYHSINVQIVVDAHCHILDIVAKWPGSTHDARILRESGISQLFQTPGIIPVKCHLLGDSGYPCKNWLLTPFLNPATQQERRYNGSHKVTRCIVKRTIGQWKRRFHVLHSEIRMCPERACRIIMACAVLHNLAKLLNTPIIDEDGESEDDFDEDSDDDDADNNRVPDNLGGRAYRNHITMNHF
ncbi:putative nuclease HARBI1 [Saccostrea echinata]|uniref:putative nuclease HARBI1 n=1 Tax=Saccostrea echinata TaxID=191078 RepID=UPI002A80A051|nr:putative nuclease HARBI1 [Saccostrea echinata]